MEGLSRVVRSNNLDVRIHRSEAYVASFGFRVLRVVLRVFGEDGVCSGGHNASPARGVHCLV